MDTRQKRTIRTCSWTFFILSFLKPKDYSFCIFSGYSIDIVRNVKIMIISWNVLYKG